MLVFQMALWAFQNNAFSFYMDVLLAGLLSEDRDVVIAVQFHWEDQHRHERLHRQMQHSLHGVKPKKPTRRFCRQTQ